MGGLKLDQLDPEVSANMVLDGILTVVDSKHILGQLQEDDCGQLFCLSSLSPNPHEILGGFGSRRNPRVLWTKPLNRRGRWGGGEGGECHCPCYFHPEQVDETKNKKAKEQGRSLWGHSDVRWIWMDLNGFGWILEVLSKNPMFSLCFGCKIHKKNKAKTLLCCFPCHTYQRS